MRTLRRLSSRIASLLHRSRHDADLAAEIESNLELHTADNIQAGMTPEEARRQARLKFGSISATVEQCRDTRKLPVIETLAQDLRYTVRRLAKQPAFTAVALSTLALGIGGATAIFSLLHAVLLKPLPYPQPEQIHIVHEILPQLRDRFPLVPVNAGHYNVWTSASTHFAGLGAFDYQAVTLSAGGEPERVGMARITASLFDVLRTEPGLGTRFTSADEKQGRRDLVLLSHAYWQRRFGGDPSVVGRSIRVEGRNCAIVGVMPRDFHFPASNEVSPVPREVLKPDLFAPLIFSPRELQSATGNFNYFALARLADGATRGAAEAELNTIQAGIAQRVSGGMPLAASLTPLQKYSVRNARTGLLLMMCAAFTVLLIVCANLANLLLAQATARARELAIRTALGVTRARLLRQLFTESVVLACTGGALGVALSYAAVLIIRRNVAVDLPRLETAQIDVSVLAFALIVSTAAGLFFGIVPAWRLRRADPIQVIKAGGRNSSQSAAGSRIRALLVGVEAAFCAALLLIAGLVGSSLQQLLHVEKGFSTEPLVTTEVVFPEHRYKTSLDRERLQNRILDQLAAIGGISNVAVASVMPFRGHDDISIVSRVGDERPVAERPMSKYTFVSPSYFDTLQIPIVRGRIFNANDRGRHVAVISEWTASRIWPGQNPIGQKFRKVMNGPWIEIVGVAADVRLVSLSEPPGFLVYLPNWFNETMQTAVVLRTSLGSQAIAADVRKLLNHLEPEAPVSQVKPMAEVIVESVADRRFQSWLLTGFASLAIVLACFGVFGVVSYTVTQRNAEIGIRLALGASPAQILWLVVRQGLAPVLVGAVIGLSAGFAGARMLQSILFATSPADPVIGGAAVALLLAVATLACYLPACRAAHVDPAFTLRAE